MSWREPLKAINDQDLANKTAEFKNRLANGETLEDIQAEAFAVCQEACDRRLGILNILDESLQFPLEKLGTELESLVLQARQDLAAGKPHYERFFLELCIKKFGKFTQSR
jgi:preprotein translocase subunit SecA